MIRRTHSVWLALAKPVLLAVAILFLYAALEKLQDVPAFVATVRSHGVIQGKVALFAAVAVLVAECVVGIGCAFAALGTGRPIAWCWAASMLFFVLALYGALAFAAEVIPASGSCGCGVRFMPGLGWKPVIVQDVLLGGTLLALAWCLRAAGKDVNELRRPALQSP